MLKANYKLVCLLIWLTGIFSIDITWALCHEHLYNLFWGTLISSIPFAALAWYTKKVFENYNMSSHYKRIRFSGITCAYVLTILAAIFSFAASMGDALNAAGAFWLVGFGTIFLGFIVGGVAYVFIASVFKSRN